jgi:membrane protease YdiL (CAAX protease family)
LTVQNLKTRPFTYILVFYSAWLARLMALPLIDPPKSAFFSHLVFGVAGRFVVWCLLPATWIILIEKRALASALHPVERHSIRMVLALTVFLTVILLLGMRLTRGHWFIIPAGHSTLEYLVFVGGVWLLALGEEFTFRGVFLSGLLRSGFPFWQANAIAAAAFALSHWPGWLMFGGMPAIDLLTATVRVFVFGCVMGGLVRAEGGLIAAISIHTLNDVLVGTLL